MVDSSGVQTLLLRNSCRNCYNSADLFVNGLQLVRQKYIICILQLEDILENTLYAYIQLVH